MKRSVLFLFAVLVLLAGAQPVTAQIIVAEDPSGERVLMSETLRRAEHDIMIRAVARTSDEQLVWALMFRSTDAASDVTITADGKAVEAQRIATDEEAPGGKTTVFLSGETFYNVAHASKVTVTIGERALTLPKQIHKDMQAILNRSKG